MVGPCPLPCPPNPRASWAPKLSYSDKRTLAYHDLNASRKGNTPASKRSTPTAQEDVCYLAQSVSAATPPWTVNKAEWFNPCFLSPWSTVHRLTLMRNNKPVLGIQSTCPYGLSLRGLCTIFLFPTLGLHQHPWDIQSPRVPLDLCISSWRGLLGSLLKSYHIVLVSILKYTYSKWIFLI